MKCIICLLLFSFSTSIYAKEWKNIKVFQNETQKQKLSPSDWLMSDRVNYTLVWQDANRYNLENNLPKEYTRIIERRDFYKWIHIEYSKQGHEVVWATLAHFISNKLRLMQAFPYAIFSSHKMKEYVNNGSEVVFINSFKEIKNVFKSDIILRADKAIQWDSNMLYKEQYLWVDSVYKKMDKHSLKKTERIAKGKFLYGLVVPKAIRFKGDISSAEARYNYATKTLKNYCKGVYK